MPLPDQTPRLQKWPFLLGDVALLGAAWLISDLGVRPLSSEAIVAIVGCVALAATIGVIPFLADYARRQDEALDDRQRSLEALSRTATAAAEQISIAAGGFHEIAELAQKNLKHAEQLPHKLQEKIAEFQSRLAQAREERDEEQEKELAALRSSESERLESIADKVARAASDWARIEASSQKHLAAAKAVLAEFDERIGRLKSAAAAEAPAPAAPPPTEEPAAATEAKSAPPEESPAASPPPAAESSAVPAPIAPPLPAKPPRKRAAKKEAIPPPAPPPETEPTLGLEGADAAPTEFSQLPEDTAPVDSVSSDGATRLTVTAYIGIGNRLFIRGEGGGLNRERGVPLQFVSIGKWRWEALDLSVPVAYKLYKNDQLECAALGEQTLEPGHHQEVTATF